MPYCKDNGPDIYYEVSGEGPPLVFVHANPFDHRLWMYQVARFAAFFKCVSMDLRGYGRSGKPETPFTLADMKNDVLGVCRKEGITRAVFCGCSVGSGIALLTALDHPAMVDALILVGGNSRGSTNVERRAEGFKAARDVPAFLQDYMRELFAPGFPDTPRGRYVMLLFAENAATLSGLAIANIHLARGACDMSHRLGEVTAPTLVINGAHDNSLAAGTHTAQPHQGRRARHPSRHRPRLLHRGPGRLRRRHDRFPRPPRPHAGDVHPQALSVTRPPRTLAK